MKGLIAILYVTGIAVNTIAAAYAYKAYKALPSEKAKCK